MKISKIQIGGIALGILVITIAMIFFRQNKLFYFLIVCSGFVFSLPFIISIIFKRNKEKELEERFLEFIRDLVENVNSGTPISKSIINLEKRDYGPLSNYVVKLANQISLGIPLTGALSTFANDIKSPVILRAVGLISEAEKAGGRIDTILDSVLRSVNQTEELKKERKSAIYNLSFQGYIIFIVFIIIMLVLQFKILPLASGAVGDVGSLEVKIKAVSSDQFSLPLFILLLIQSFFGGLVIGKISEGSFKDGIKHAFILIVITLFFKTGADVLFG